MKRTLFFLIALLFANVLFAQSNGLDNGGLDDLAFYVIVCAVGLFMLFLLVAGLIKGRS